MMNEAPIAEEIQLTQAEMEQLNFRPINGAEIVETAKRLA